MRRRQFVRGNRARQRGVALMLLMLLAIVTASAIFVAVLSQPGSRNTLQEQDRNQQALLQARDALIAFAANQKIPGQLPCPENTAMIGTSTEGSALGSCTLPAIGRLPWYTLNLGDLRDASGERLWYAISPGFRTAPINSDTPAQLTVDGVANTAVAIIFSAGPPLSGQTRPIPTSAAPPLVANYLDLDNNDSDGTFVTTGAAGQFNDKLMIVTAAQLFRVVERRVLSDVAWALNEYFICGSGSMDWDGTCIAGAPNNFYPRPASFSSAQCLGTATINAGNCTENTGITAGRIPADPTVGWGPTSLLQRVATGTSVWVSGSNLGATNWFQRNGWRELIYYSADPVCTTAPACATGTVAPSPVIGSKYNRVVLVSAGTALSGQLRVANADKTSEFNYLEGENVSPLDNVFAAWPPVGVPYNDITLGIP
jgi:hypothetical protein